MGGCLAGLPHVPDGLDGEVACVVVDEDLVDLPAASPGTVVLVHQPVFVGFEGGPEASWVWFRSFLEKDWDHAKEVQ